MWEFMEDVRSERQVELGRWAYAMRRLKYSMKKTERRENRSAVFKDAADSAKRAKDGAGR